MRVLFYLPVITPWWFEAIVAPLIARLAPEHEVHVLAPAPWRNTGIGQSEQRICADIPVVWHIVHDPSHPGMRTEPEQRAGLVAFAKSLAPDYVLCRSADCETVEAFPGTVRHIMEGGADPLGLPSDWIVFQERPFDHGLLPEMSTNQLAELDRLSAPLRDSVIPATTPDREQREAFRQWAGLPEDRPILLLPLEYEHEENFFPMHRLGPTPNARLVEELAREIGQKFFLAVTNHPLNEKHVDNRALKAAIARLGPGVRLFPSTDPNGSNTTQMLMREADGVILFDSKVYALAAHCGVPVLRRTRFATGDWLNAYARLDEFLAAVKDRRAIGPDADKARTWLAYHVANNLIDPKDPQMRAADILARLDHPFDPGRWERAFERYYASAGQVAS